MRIVARLPTRNHALYTLAQLVRLRRLDLFSARSLAPGSERNQRRQVAASIKSLLNNSDWLHANTLDSVLMGGLVDDGKRPRHVPLNHPPQGSA